MGAGASWVYVELSVAIPYPEVKNLKVSSPSPSIPRTTCFANCGDTFDLVNIAWPVKDHLPLGTYLGPINQRLAREHRSDWDLSHLVHLFSGSCPLSEAKVPHCEEDAGVLWDVPSLGTQRDVVHSEFTLTNDTQCRVDLFSVSRLTRRFLGSDTNHEEATFMVGFVPSSLNM